MPRKFLYLLMKNFGLSPLKVSSSTVLSTTVLSITSMAEFREKPGQISHSYNNSLLVKYQTVQFLLWCLSNRVLQNRSFNFYLQLSISIELKHKSIQRLNTGTIQMTYHVMLRELAFYERIGFQNKMKVTEGKSGAALSSHQTIDISVTLIIMAPV